MKDKTDLENAKAFVGLFLFFASPLLIIPLVCVIDSMKTRPMPSQLADKDQGPWQGKRFVVGDVICGLSDGYKREKERFVYSGADSSHVYITVWTSEYTSHSPGLATHVLKVRAVKGAEFHPGSVFGNEFVYIYAVESVEDNGAVVISRRLK